MPFLRRKARTLCFLTYEIVFCYCLARRSLVLHKVAVACAMQNINCRRSRRYSGCGTA